MSLTYIGPHQLAAHYDPTFQFTAAPETQGARSGRIGGYASWDTVKALSELLANRDRRVTFGGSLTGVLERVWCDDDFLRNFSGWYLLNALELQANQQDSLSDVVGFTLDCAHLGADRRPVVTRSAVARANSHSVVGRAILVQPFWGDDASGEPFETDPGGTAFTREYDPRTLYDAAAPATTGRNLRIHEGQAA